MVSLANDEPIFFLRFVLIASCAHVQWLRISSQVDVGRYDRGRCEAIQPH